MKLAKKMLACVMALALIGCFAAVAFAAGPATVKATADDTAPAVGETIKVTITLDGAKGVAASNIFFTYDKDVLEYVSAASATNAAVVEAGLVAAGECSVGFMVSSALEDESVNLATFEFKVLKAGDAKIAFETDKFSMTDADDADVTFSAADLTIAAVAEKAATTAEPTTTDGETTTKKTSEIPATGDAGLAVAAGLVVLAGAAFVVSKKRK